MTDRIDTPNLPIRDTPLTQTPLPRAGDLPYYGLAALLGLIGALHVLPGNGIIVVMAGICALIASAGMILEKPWAEIGIGGFLGVEIVRVFISLLMLGFALSEEPGAGFVSFLGLSTLVSSLIGMTLAIAGFCWDGARLRWANGKIFSERLASAAGKGQIDKALLWLAAGADVNHVNRKVRRTALVSAASKNGNARVVAMLLNAGADPRLAGRAGVTKFGRVTTPLEAADRSGSDENVTLIREALAGWNASNSVPMATGV